MKTNYDDYFSKDKIKKFIGKMDELAENKLKELGFDNLEEGSNPSEDQIKLVRQTVKERVIAEIFAKGENITNLWLAINDKDSAKITALKGIITDNDYLDTLATSLFINSTERNDEVVKSLLTKTEIVECNNLKAEMVSAFFQIENETDWNGEIIELLLANNEKSHKAFFDEIHNLLCEPSISNEFLINTCFKHISDVNEPVIINSSTDGGQTFHEEQSSLLMRTIHTKRPELTKYLIAQGAHVLPSEVSFILYNPEIFSDEFLIDCLKSDSDVNKPVISNVSTDEGQSFHEEQSSLLSRALNNRPGLTKWLADQGAYLLPTEIHQIMWNSAISDESLIGCFKNNSLDINDPLIIKVWNEESQTFHEEQSSLLMLALQSNRLGLTKWLVNEGDADVNCRILHADGRISKAYSNIYKIELFEILVASGRLTRDSDMDSKWIAVDSGGTYLELSKCYDLLTWKNNFETSLNNRFVSFKNWLGTECMHKADNLFTIPQKFLNTAITYLSDDVLLRKLQDKYGNDFITLNINNVGPLITDYFVQNWHQSMLICKDFGDHSVFSLVELRCLIGQELYSYQWDQFAAQVVEVTGEEGGVDPYL